MVNSTNKLWRCLRRLVTNSQSGEIPDHEGLFIIILQNTYVLEVITNKNNKMYLQYILRQVWRRLPANFKHSNQSSVSIFTRIIIQFQTSCEKYVCQLVHYYIQLWNKEGGGKGKEWHILTTWWMSFEGKELPSAIRWEGSGRGGGRTFIKVVGAHCRNCLVGLLNMAVNGNKSSTQIGDKKRLINGYSSTFELLQNFSYPNEAWFQASTAK